MNIDVVDAIETYFRSQSALTEAFHGGQLYNVEAPERATFPYATHMLISEIPADTTTDLQLITAQVQIGVYHSSAKLARTAGRLITDAFDKASFIVGSDQVDHCLRVGGSLTKLEGYGPNGTDAWLASFDYEILFHRLIGQ